MISQEECLGALRRLVGRLALAALVLSGAIGIADADVNLPLNRQPFVLDYELAYRTMVIQQDLTLLPPIGPYYQSDFSTIGVLDDFSPALAVTRSLSEDHIRLFSLNSGELQFRNETESRGLTSLAGGLHYQPSRYFGAFVMFGLDRAKALDPDYTGKKWRGLAGDIETSAIYFRKDNLTATLGRQRVFWGPQPVNLILSQTAEPLDLLSVRYRKGRLHFSFLFARLDQSRPDSTDYVRLPDRTFNDNRYLVGHRLDIEFSNSFRLGLFETSLFGGEGRAPELYYLNPLQFFHTAQLNEHEDDNTILGLDFQFLPYPSYNVYGQFIIDDLQIDDKSQGDQEPNELGFMLGLFRAGGIGTMIPDLRLEYVRITNRTYHQADPRNRYLYRNKLLGHPLGPDADSLSLALVFRPGRLQSVTVETAFRRHGEGSLYKPWDQPWMETEGDYREPFPTGTVERAVLAAVGFSGYVPLSRYTSEHLFLNCQAGFGSIDNKANVDGKNSDISWLNLSIGWLGHFDLGLGD